MPRRTPATPIVALAALAATGCSNGGDAGIGTVPTPAVRGAAVLVVNGAGGSVTLVDADALALAGTVRLTGVRYPHHIGLSPDGRRVVVAAPGEDLRGGHGGGHHRAATGGALLVLDATTGETLAARRLPAPNHNGLFSPDGGAIWTTQSADVGTLLRLDPRTLETLQELPVGAMPAEVTASVDGRYLFVANTMSDDVSVVDVAASAVVKTIAVGAGPVGAWPGADGVMYVDAEAGRSITAIDVDTLTVTRSWALGFKPGMAALAPGTGELWVTDADGGGVTFWSTATATTTGRTATGAGAHGVVFSPDGSRAFVTNQRADTLSVLDAATRAVIATLPMGGAPNGLVFRPAVRRG